MTTDHDEPALLQPPLPKFKVGDRVWLADVVTTKEATPCPDCLGQKVWKLKSPAGEDFEMNCPRCGSVGALSCPTFKGSARPLTVGRVTSSTSTSYSKDDSLVQYMCRETGVGSGTIYQEKCLFEDESTAAAAADLIVREKSTVTAHDDWRKRVLSENARPTGSAELSRTKERASIAERALSELKIKIVDMVDEYGFLDDLSEVSYAALRKVSLYLVPEDDEARS